MDINFYRKTSYQVSKLITKKYSTSFSLATSMLEKEVRTAIYGIYGFVRLADEIVDSFENHDKETLLKKLNEDLDYALQHKISSNLVLMAFADTVHKYSIDRKLIDAFMKSMESDLTKKEYSTPEEIAQYIYGSADVVGLMCLHIFCNMDKDLYKKLEKSAQKLGSAFQKVNFLRDLKNDKENLGRVYFPEIANAGFNEASKIEIEASIQKEFDEAFIGLKQLPGRSKLAVALAYYYYVGLFNKIRKTHPNKIMNERVRISDARKYWLIFKVSSKYVLNVI